MSPRRKGKRKKYKPKRRSYIHRISVSFKPSQWKRIMKKFEKFKEARGDVTLSYFMRVAVLRGLEMHQAIYAELRKLEK